MTCGLNLSGSELLGLEILSEVMSCLMNVLSSYCFRESSICLIFLSLEGIGALGFSCTLLAAIFLFALPCNF